MAKTFVTLNNKDLSKCYAFELAIIYRNLPEDGMRCSHHRRMNALYHLRARAMEGEGSACFALDELRAEGTLHG